LRGLVHQEPLLHHSAAAHRERLAPPGYLRRLDFAWRELYRQCTSNQHRDDRVVEGRYLAVEFPRRVVVTWGRHGSLRLPPGGSTLEVSFATEGSGTRVTVSHEGLPDAERDLHAMGWAHYLPRLAAAAAGAAVDAHHVPVHLLEGAD
jgi:uncharacterized protein YndB with AHSA1/START domain